MLQELRVSNFAIIENLQISFRGGLNILSGETGAGKSILLKSLGLLMGDKADATSIRTGAEFALIEGSFDISHRPDIRGRLSDMGIECHDDTMVVRRIVASGSKARVYINGALSTLGGLREVVSPLVEVTGHAVPLIEMTGQHDNRHLLARSYHLELLDQYAGCSTLRAEFTTLFDRLQANIKRRDELRTNARERAQRLDFLVFSRDEIRALNLKSGDEVEIESEAKRVKHGARLTEFAALVDGALESDEDSVLARLKRLVQRANDLRNLDPTLPERLEPVEQARALLDDVAYAMREYAGGLEADPERLEELESRLSRLRQLQKKYGPTADAILSAGAAMEAEIAELEASDDRIAEIESENRTLESMIQSMGRDLHNRRQSASVLFEKEVNEELADLNMKGVLFVVNCELLAEPQASGFSDVEFMTKTSRADAPRSLAKAASGGELSRILLSLKRVVGTGSHPRTYLFDEVDAGVSGETAEKVGRKLHAISKGQQVICVTHLPQVACSGDVHFFIEKNRSSRAAGTKGFDSGLDRASMTVTELKNEERVREIARLISGEKLTATSIAHAEQLLSGTYEVKSKPSARVGAKQRAPRLSR